MKQAAYLAQYAALRGVLAASRGLSHPRKRAVVGRAFAAVATRGGLGRRADANLAMAFPELDARTRAAMVAACARNVGATLANLWFPWDFEPEVAGVAPEGQGWDALEEARRQGRGVILLTGHFGQFETLRHVLRRAGMPAGGLFRPNNNPFYERYWLDRALWNGGPAVPKGRAGHAAMERAMAAGGRVFVLPDQAVLRAEPMDFLGHPALTSTGAAKLAARHDALLLCAWGPVDGDPVRGGGYRAIFDAPMDAADPEAAMAAFNARLGAMVRDYPAQWHWFHDRWKAAPPRKS